MSVSQFQNSFSFLSKLLTSRDLTEILLSNDTFGFKFYSYFKYKKVH